MEHATNVSSKMIAWTNHYPNVMTTLVCNASSLVTVQAPLHPYVSPLPVLVVQMTNNVKTITLRHPSAMKKLERATNALKQKIAPLKLSHSVMIEYVNQIALSIPSA
jgi:hypothetical protein